MGLFHCSFAGSLRCGRQESDDRLVCTAGLPFNVEGVANAIRVVEAAGLDCWGGHCTVE